MFLGDDVSRRLVFFQLVMLCFVLCGCNHYASMENVTPNIASARYNAQLGLTYLKKGATDEALVKLNLAQEQAPTDPLVLDSLGYFYEVMGDKAKANGYYSGAIVQAPDSGMVINIYGAFLCRQGYYNASIQYFMRAAATGYAQRSQAFANARYCAAMIERELGDRQKSAYYSNLLNTLPSTIK